MLRKYVIDLFAGRWSVDITQTKGKSITNKYYETTIVFGLPNRNPKVLSGSVAQWQNVWVEWSRVVRVPTTHPGSNMDTHPW